MSVFFLAPLVIAKRMPQLMFEALHPNPMVSDESRRAVTEKFEAMSEGMIAAQTEAMCTPFRVGLAFFSGHSAAAAAMNAPGRVADAAVEPMKRKLRANVRRLTRSFPK